MRPTDKPSVIGMGLSERLSIDRRRHSLKLSPHEFGMGSTLS
jgi:hypothetical protein